MASDAATYSSPLSVGLTLVGFSLPRWTNHSTSHWARRLDPDPSGPGGSNLRGHGPERGHPRIREQSPDAGPDCGRPGAARHDAHLSPQRITARRLTAAHDDLIDAGRAPVPSARLDSRPASDGHHCQPGGPGARRGRRSSSQQPPTPESKTAACLHSRKQWLDMALDECTEPRSWPAHQHIPIERALARSCKASRPTF